MTAIHVLSKDNDLSFVAASDLSAKQYYAVEATDTDNTVDVGTGASTTYGMIGVLQNAPSSGGEAQVRVFGPTKAVVDSSVTAVFGSWATRNASGKFDVTTTASLAVGWYLSTPDAAASSIAEIFIFPFCQWLTSNHA